MMLMPSTDEMYRALVERDQAFDGLFLGASLRRAIAPRPHHRRAGALLPPRRDAMMQNRRVDWETHQIGPSRLLADGVDIRIIQLMLGHGSVQQTQRYLNVTDEELRRGLEVSWRRARALRLVENRAISAHDCPQSVTTGPEAWCAQHTGSRRTEGEPRPDPRPAAAGLALARGEPKVSRGLTDVLLLRDSHWFAANRR
jgi:hypothetical protein